MWEGKLGAKSPKLFNSVEKGCLLLTR